MDALAAKLEAMAAQRQKQTDAPSLTSLLEN
jgi:hypothetical protein